MNASQVASWIRWSSMAETTASTRALPPEPNCSNNTSLNSSKAAWCLVLAVKCFHLEKTHCAKKVILTRTLR